MDESKEVSTRRAFLRKIGQQAINIAAGAVVGGTIGAGLEIGAEAIESLTKKGPLPEKVTPNPGLTIATAVATAVAATPEPTLTPRLDYNSMLSRIASAELNTPERDLAEESIVNYAFSKNDLTAKDIDQALWVVVDPHRRMSLLGLRYNLRREKSDPHLVVLSADKEKWALEHGISDETLAIALDSYPKARRILEALIKHDKAKFRPDVLYREQVGLLPKGTFENLTAERMMINPGGMAKLISTETGGVTFVLDNGKDVTKPQFIHEGFTTIGDHSAWSETNIDFFPTGHISLENLNDLLQNKTDVNYQTRNIPGSARGDQKINASGGAVGIQMMPDNVMEILKMINNPALELDNKDRWLNIFDLEDSTVMAWIFIARGVRVSNEPDSFRTGYLKGPEVYHAKMRNWAIEKWNPFKPQRDAIISAANSYSDKFLA